MSTSPVRIDPGSVIGPYVVERRLAQGGMSILYLARASASARAHDETVAREVVLKMVPDELATSSSRARLFREARSLASLDHPGIVRVYGTGDHEGTPWIAMEYVRGKDLKKVVAERGPVSSGRALRWLAQACEALAAAHDAGVIHRDLKPSNLLLTADDQIKIVDFGIAKRRADAGGDVLTSQREVLGTPAYLSPEQLEHGLADERSDVWALGCVLYELCVGVPPFGRSGSATTIAAILRDEPELPPHLGEAVTHIVSACLRKSSFARVASPRELLAMVRDAIDDPSSPPVNDGRTSAFSSRPPSVAPPAYRPSDPPTRASQRPSTSRTPIRGSTPPPGLPSGFSSSTMRAAVKPQIGRIKGTAIRAGLVWFGATYGADSMPRLYELASPELQAILRADDPGFGIIASGWYDTQCIGELLELMERVGDPDDPDAYCNSLTTAIAKDNVGGIYRSLFRLIASPAMLEANAQRVWRTYLDEGTCVARAPSDPAEGRGHLLFEVRGWNRHHPTVCRVVGFMMQNVLRAIGYTALIVERTHCVGSGDACCTFDGMYLG